MFFGASFSDCAISPIREALSRLSVTGLVDFKDNKGFFVASINRTELFDIAETYVDIESLALRKAMEKGDEAWEMQIAAELHRLSKVETGKKVDFSTWAECNANFHHALVSGCKSNSLMRCRNMLFQQHDRYMRLSYFYSKESDIKINHSEHSALAKTVIARQEDKAISALREHQI